MVTLEERFMHPIVETEKPLEYLDSLRCPECNSRNLIYDKDVGELVCTGCGYVIGDEMYDMKPEWRAYTKEEKEKLSRVGPPTSYFMYNKGLSTYIDKVNYDAHKRKLSLSTKQQMRRLRKRQMMQLSVERNLFQAMNELENLSDRLSVPDIVKEKAALIYRKALKENLVRGRSISGVIAASLYAACRSTGTLRSLKEVEKASMTDKKKIARYYRVLLKSLDIHIPNPDHFAYLKKIGEIAHLSGGIQSDASKILKKAKEIGMLSGKTPRGFDGAALYIASIINCDKRTQRDLANAAGITQVTLRNRKNELMKKLEIKINI